MHSPEMTDARDARETTRELDDARAKYRGKIIPKPALRVMDAETARLAASRLASRALKAGDSAPDFILPDAQGNPVRLYSLLREGHVVVVFYRGELTHKEHQLIEARFRESGAMRRQPKIKLRLRDSADGNLKSVSPRFPESLEYPRARLDCFRVVLLQALLIEIQQSGEGHLRGIGVDPSLFLLFVFELPIRQFPIVSLETFPDQLALNSEDRIIGP